MSLVCVESSADIKLSELPYKVEDPWCVFNHLFPLYNKNTLPIRNSKTWNMHVNVTQTKDFSIILGYDHLCLIEA